MSCSRNFESILNLGHNGLPSMNSNWTIWFWSKSIDRAIVLCFLLRRVSQKDGGFELPATSVSGPWSSASRNSISAIVSSGFSGGRGWMHGKVRGWQVRGHSFYLQSKNSFPQRETFTANWKMNSLMGHTCGIVLITMMMI